jgi:hypothetical protein
VPTADDVRHEYAVPQRHCQAVRRPYKSILRSHTTYPLVLGPTTVFIQGNDTETAQLLAESVVPHAC